MLLFLRDLLYGVAVMAGMAVVYTSLGVLNGRLPGGFTVGNLAWSISAAVLAVAVLGGIGVKLVLLSRRRRQKPLRMHPSGTRWVSVDDD